MENLTEVPTEAPVEITIANTTYNQVPSPDYNSQNVVYAKKPKNKLFAVIACILAVVIVGVGGFFAYTFITAENHEEVALNYAKALANAEYDGIESRLVFDVDKLFYDMCIQEYIEDGLSPKEALAELKKDFIKNANVNIEDEEDLFYEYCEFYSKQMKVRGHFVEAEFKGSEKMDNEELYEFIEDWDEEFEEVGLDLDDYMNMGKIKGAYNIRIDVKERYAGEDTNEENMSFVVVKYGMKWKVIDFTFID